MFFQVTFFLHLSSIALVSCARKQRPVDTSSSRQASVEGVVGAGNYTYYVLDSSSEDSVRLRLLLHTLDGDADLYVAGRNERPTFDPEKHEFQSTTCGTDAITVSASLVQELRPLVVGVYGKIPSHLFLSTVFPCFL